MTASTPPSLLVLADDLTGANDTSVRFAARGFATTLVSQPAALAHLTNTEVAALSTNARAQGRQAAEITFHAVQEAIAAGITSLYLKVDSTMRGSVQHQIKGALAAWASRHRDPIAVVCPAYPAQGRIISDATLLVSGTPVHLTASGRDPICPVTSADMTKLLPGAVWLPGNTNPTVLAEQIVQAGDVVVLDSATATDLQTISQAITLIGPRALPVGSAGLAGALAPQLPPPQGLPSPEPLPITGRTLIVVSSIHESSQGQVDNYIGTCAGAAAIVFSPHPAQLLAPTALPALRAQLLALATSGDGNIIVRANPAKVACTLGREELAAHFAQQLAALVGTLFRHVPIAALILVGGDGAAAVLQELGCTQLRVLRSIAAGVPLATTIDGASSGLGVITKSGGFGEPELLTTIMATIGKPRTE